MRYRVDWTEEDANVDFAVEHYTKEMPEISDLSVLARA